jgi:hypothetical protein
MGTDVPPPNAPPSSDERRWPAHLGVVVGVLSLLFGYGASRSLCGPEPIAEFVRRGIVIWAIGLALTLAAFALTRPRRLGVWLEVGVPAALLVVMIGRGAVTWRAGVEARAAAAARVAQLSSQQRVVTCRR